MHTAIIIDNDPDSLNKAIERMSQMGSVAEIAVASTRSRPEDTPSKVVWRAGQSYAEALRILADQTATKKIILVTASEIPSAAILMQISNSNENAVAILSSVSDQIDQTSPAALIAALSKAKGWPVSAIKASRRSLILSSAYDSLEVGALVSAIAIAATVERDGDIQIFKEAGEIKNPVLSDASCAEILRTALDSFNIEELFPELAWQEHNTESAALAYHTLTALFIRFGELESANQCLTLSETLEESPRYFALKGFIAERRGEALGAVANMVSSLQCYESRKNNDGSHLLEFKPLNIEVINTKLVQGLDALHKRDNEGAYGHFFQAVTSFDSFYKQFGVEGK